MNTRLKVGLVGLFFALMFTYAGAKAYLDASRLSFRSANIGGWSAYSSEGSVRVTSVDAEGPANVLRKGDEIVALGGRALESYYQISGFFQGITPGTPYSIVVRRDGRQEKFTLQTVPVPVSWSVDWFIETILTPAIFLLTGLVIFFLKPFDKHALMVALMFGMVVPGTMDSFSVGLSWWLVVVMVAGFTASNFIFPVSFQLSLTFPEPSPLFRRFPRLEWLLYLPHFLIRMPYIMVGSILLTIASERRFASPFPFLYEANMLLALMYVVGAVILVTANYQHSNQVARRKLRVMTAGIVAGLLPWISLWTIDLGSGFVPTGLINWTLWNWLNAAAHAALVVVPISFTYAILRHRVIPVSLIVRRGVQYLLAKNALRLILALPIIGLVLTILSNPHRTLAEIIFRNSIYFYLLLIFTVAISLIFHRRLSEWIDRKFFREHYDQEKILRDLVDSVKKLDSMRDVSGLVSRKVDAALHPERMHLFYREKEKSGLSVGYSSGANSQELDIPEDFQLLHFVGLQGCALDFPFPPKNHLPANEKEWLARLGVNLIVPISGTDERLLGLFLLGEKKSEVPYTTTDRELLETLAGQIGFVYENMSLKERLDYDRQVKQKVLARFESQQINLLKECPTCGVCFDSSVELCNADGSELRLTLPVERVIEERYRLEKLLARGGMGAVYEAIDLRLNRKVAVKILRGSMFGDPVALRRFNREARTLARLNHPNIVVAHDYGELHTEGAYLVMDLVGGESLGTVLKREGRIPAQEAAEWFDQVLEGIKAAHTAGIIHRDLKPENILITRHENGQPLLKILDFGLAKFIAKRDISDAHNVTTVGVVMGTIGYMSPEQLMGDEVDERSDLFAIGVIIVESLTGSRPFKGGNLNELLNSIQDGSFQLEETSRELGRLNKAFQKCLARNRTERYGSAAEMQSELIPALRECPSVVAQSSAQSETIVVDRLGH